MPNPYLTSVRRVVLQAGHGQGDPGAVANGTTENSENNQIVSRVARMLRFNKIETVIDPDLGLVNAINYVNQNHKLGQDWCLEIHKDSATGVDSAALENRLGVYYYAGDSDSQAIATQMSQIFKKNGANNLSCARPDTVARFGRLGWIRDTIPLAHLIECGFIQADTGDASDERYAKWVAQAICDALGKTFMYDLTQSNNPVDSKPWLRIADFEKLPNAEYYISSFNSNNWGRILSDISDRDREVSYDKTILAQNSRQIKDLENQLKDAQNKLASQTQPKSNLIDFLNKFDYAGLPFDITESISTNNLTFILNRFKAIDSNYKNTLARDQILKSQTETIRDQTQVLINGF